MYDSNISIDLTTVAQKLSQDEDIIREGGAYYLSKLTDNVTTTAHINTHIEIVIEMYKKRDYDPSIVFCGIQSVHKKASNFVKVDLVLIDEVHLVPRKTNTMYQRFLSNLKIMNPHMRVIGLTATPYRLDSGLLHTGKEALFDAVCFR